MVFPIVAPPNLQGPWCEQFWIYTISESFHVNMTNSGSVILKKKIFKWPNPIFVITSPFEEDLALYLSLPPKKVIPLTEFSENQSHPCFYYYWQLAKVLCKSINKFMHYPGNNILWHTDGLMGQKHYTHTTSLRGDNNFLVMSQTTEYRNLSRAII
jgi:hypothetical protein